jgi:hypothetical protein
MHWSIRIPDLVRDRRRARGLVDTSVVVDLERIDAHSLPERFAISAISLAELTARPRARKTSDFVNANPQDPHLPPRTLPRRDK